MSGSLFDADAGPGPDPGAGPDPAGGDARRSGGRQGGGSGRGRQRRPGTGFGEGGRGRGARRGGSSTGPDSAAAPAEEMADPEAVARGICLRALTGAAKTRQQLAELLARKDVPPAAAEAVLDRFSEVGLIDDAAFAKAWVSSRQTSRGLSRRALANELRGKGVDAEVAAAAVAEVDPQDEWDTARTLVRRKAPSMRRLDRVTAERRLVGMLARKGYGGGLAGIVVREALDELTAEDDAAGDLAAGDPDEELPDEGDSGEAAEEVAATVRPRGSGLGRSRGFGSGGSGWGGLGCGGFGSGGFGSGGSGSGGFGGRKSARRTPEGKPNGSGLGGAGGISGQRAASMADEVGEGHGEPIGRRPT